MAFDYMRAKENARKDLDNKLIGALILGPTGAGKSGLCGTFGVKTLFLYTGGEAHGATSANMRPGASIVGIRIDEDDEGNKLNSDAAYNRILEILDNKDLIKSEGFGAIVIDSLTEIEAIIRGTTQFRSYCLTDKGKHNSYEEGKAACHVIRPIMVKLLDLQLSLGVHYAATCLMEVSEWGEDLRYVAGKPALATSKFVDFLMPQFPDKFAVGEMVDPQGKRVHRIQFNVDVSKISKDVNGAIKRENHYRMRLTGVDNLPSHMEPNLSKVASMKERGAS